jgi:hypothetical protein
MILKSMDGCLDRLPDCELCKHPATHFDSAWPDGVSDGHVNYRKQWLCFVHALERLKVNTARVTEIACEL